MPKRKHISNERLSDIRSDYDFWTTWRFQVLTAKYQVVISVLLVFTGFFLGLTYQSHRINPLALCGLVITLTLAVVAYLFYKGGRDQIQRDAKNSHIALDDIRQQLRDYLEQRH